MNKELEAFKESRKMWQRIGALCLLVLVMGVGIAAKEFQAPEKKIYVHVGERVPNYLKPEKVQQHAGCTIYRTMTEYSVDYWVDTTPYCVTSFPVEK